MRNIQKLADASAQIQTVLARTSNMPAVTFEPQSGSRVVFMQERPALENIGSVNRKWFVWPFFSKIFYITVNTENNAQMCAVEAQQLG